MDVEITLCSSSTDSNSDQNLYYLQKWLKKWNCFVIIDDSKDILEGDRLTMCKKGSTGGNEVEVSDVFSPCSYYIHAAAIYKLKKGSPMLSPLTFFWGTKLSNSLCSFQTKRLFFSVHF